MDIPTVVWFIVVGFAGAFSRLCLQWYRDKKLTQTPIQMFALFFMGAVGGWIVFQLGSDYIAAWALGFVFPDVAENLAAAYAPTPPSE